jgi:hypothetical protein
MLGLLALLASPAVAHDYPTVERVLYVESCVRDHPDRNRQEMIYKCACAIDAIAQQLSYDEFVEGATAVNAGQAAGERGTAVRESATGRGLAGAYREAQAEAFRRCLIQ